MQKSSNLTKKLAAYSAAATIAVGAGAAHAVGVLRDIPDTTLNVGESLDIDFDQDGDPEFIIAQTMNSYGFAVIAGEGGGSDRPIAALVGFTNGPYYYASRLATGDPINSMITNWVSTTQTLAYYTNGSFAGQRGYVGVQFQLDGVGPFYGWIELEVNADSTQTTVYRYYYDDAGAGLFAGQSPTAVTMSDITTTTASDPMGIMGLLTGALTALSGVGLWVQRRFLSRKSGE